MISCSPASIELVCKSRYSQEEYDHVLFVLELMMLQHGIATFLTAQENSMMMDYVCSF